VTAAALANELVEAEGEYRDGWESGLDKLGQALAAGSAADRAVNSPD